MKILKIICSLALLSVCLQLNIQAKKNEISAVFDTPYRHTLSEDTRKIRKSSQTHWEDTVWKNDTLDAKIVVYSEQDLTNCKIIASDLSNEEHTLSSDHYHNGWINETQANIGNSHPEAPVERFPDVIHKDQPVSIASDTLKSFWISLSIPSDTPSGIYTGTLEVHADQLDEPLTLTLSAEVLQHAVPDASQSSTQIELWQHPYTTARYFETEPFSDRHCQILLEQLQEYASMGGRAVTATIVEEAWNHQSYDSDPSMVKWIRHPDGSFSFDYSHFDKWIELAIQAGILDPRSGRGQIKAYSIAPWGNFVSYYNEADGTTVRTALQPGSEEWTWIWSTLITDFLAHTKDKGWFDLVYLSMDEREQDLMLQCIDLIRSITDENGNSFKISSAMNYSIIDDYALLDEIDDISLGLITIDDKSSALGKCAEHRRNNKQLTTIYTCSSHYPSAYLYSDMSETAWSLWYTMKHSVDGFLRWSWDGWVEDPLNDASYRTFEPGDPWLIYPSEKDSTGPYFYESPRYKMLKQGIRDINKAKYLKTAYPKVSGQVDKLVSSLKRPKMKYSKYGSAIPARSSDRDLVENEVIRMRTGINEIAASLPGESEEIRETEPIPSPLSEKNHSLVDKFIHWFRSLFNLHLYS